MFNFLWAGSDVGKKIHLINWERLANPKLLGGWDIKNIFWFSMTLRMKSMWIVVFGLGLWKEVIHAKYLSRVYLISWLRSNEKYVRGASLF